MTDKSTDAPIIVFSVRVYQVLLFAYPIKFQREYGSHMSQVFRDCCLHAFYRNGTIGLLKLWVLTFFDLLRSLIEEHLQKETFMTTSKFIRLSGWSLMLGAVAFLLFTLNTLVESNFYDPLMRLHIFYNSGLLLGMWISSILLAVGLLGLRARYGEEVGSAGKGILLTGAIIGPVISLLGVIGSGARIITWAEFLSYLGNVILLACLTIFGMVAWHMKPLPRWNGLPFIAGVWFPIILPSGMIANANGVSGNLILNILKGALLLQAVALFLLGYMLQANVWEDIPASA